MILPSLKCGIRFLYVNKFRINVVFEMYGKPYEQIVFARHHGRWKTSKLRFISCHRIASVIFDYRSDGLTDDEMHFMGDFVDSLGEIADNVLHEINNISSTCVDRYLKQQAENKVLINSPCTYETKETNEKTYVYLMKHVNGLTKIGRSKSPKAREKTLQAEDPRLELIFKAITELETEKRLHAIFHDRRVRGEWFDLEERHIEWITSALSWMNAT